MLRGREEELDGVQAGTRAAVQRMDEFEKGISSDTRREREF